MNNQRISIIGAVGVPANYGGFETLVENIISDERVDGIDFTVYCSAKSYKSKCQKYRNARLKYISLKANGMQSMLYDIVSLICASINSDTILILGVSGCCFLPIYRIFSRKKLLINIDGLEHKRNKWKPWIKKFLLFSEKMAVKYADITIADNKAIQDYVWSTYKKNAVLIAYGGDHALINEEVGINVNSILNEYQLRKNEYSFSVCRIEPENNVHLTLEAFSRKQDEILVFVGNWRKSEYGINLLNNYSKYNNLILLSPVYDLNILYTLRSNCKFYIHGHSAGGTNPSLVEAMFFLKPILSFDVIYNRETTENKANYFSDAEQLFSLLNSISVDEIRMNGEAMFEIANRRYKWSIITDQYNEIFRDY